MINSYCSFVLRSTLIAMTGLTLMTVASPVVSAEADTDTGSMFSFNGFGTVGVVHSSENQADFTSSVFKPDGAGYSHDWSASVDSLVAAQVSAKFTSRLSADLQLVAEQNYNNTYWPHVEWATIKYQFTPDFNVRLGRTVVPTFLLSDTREIAYTYPWVRPPLDVYHVMPVTNEDGLDASYRMHFKEMTNTVQANFGSKNSTEPNRATAEARDAWVIADTGDIGALTVHVAYERADLNIESFNALFDAFRQFGPQGVAIADKYDSDHKAFVFFGFGASYDPGQWFVMSEWGSANYHSVLGTQSGWYVSGGYRAGKFTPYATYAQAKADNLSDPGLTVSAGQATGLNAAMNSILSTKPVESTISVGGRWDFMRNADLKLQVDHTRIGAGSTGLLSDIQPGFKFGSIYNLFSATIDFVF